MLEASFSRQLRDFTMNVDLTVQSGETLALIGENGSGKSTTLKILSGLMKPEAGRIILNGQVLCDSAARLHIDPEMRNISFMFQNYALFPHMTVRENIAYGLAVRKRPKEEIEARTNELIGRMGLEQIADEPVTRLSGGQRQRIGIARALAVEPEFIVCDEPVSALDVSIQAQIINMLEKLQQDMGLTYLFIAHDLAVVKHISQRIGVMYLGHIVELAETKELHANPLHPYTRALLSAIPAFDPEVNKARRRIILEGEIPNPLTPPKGCVFSTRCPYAKEICQQEVPALKDLSCGHQVACHFAGEI